jgi:hypothetical protein
MEYKPLNSRFAIVYITITTALLSVDIYSFVVIGSICNLYGGTLSIIFFLTLSVLFSIGYITARFKTSEGGVFSTRRLFFIPLIIAYGGVGLWTYTFLLCISHLIVDRREKLLITYWCAKDYMAGFILNHLFSFLNKDQLIALNSDFLIPYFSASIVSYLVYIADDYACLRVHLIDQSKIWHSIIEIRRSVTPNYLLSVFLASIIIILYYNDDLRYLALALPLIISAVAIYSKFYAAYVKDRATKINGQV